MCQVGVGKCMGAIFSNIGSSERLLGGKMTKNKKKMKTFCGALETVVMCLVGVGKCMGVEFRKIGSAPRVRGPSGTPKKARF